MTLLLVQMLLAAIGAVALYTFIGFVPGTDETSVLAPVTLALVLGGVAPEVVLTFFISAVVTLNLMNAIPTALVGLPGGVMSAPLMEHSLKLRRAGLASTTIRKMAVGSLIGTVVSIPLSFAISAALAPIAAPLKAQAPLLLAAGAVLLALLGHNRILALLSIVPLALLFQALPLLYKSIGVIPHEKTISISFFLGITVGPMLITLLGLLNQQRRKELARAGDAVVQLPRRQKAPTLRPSRIVTRGEGLWSAGLAAASTPLFFLSPVGITFLLGELSAKRRGTDIQRSERAVTVMSALTHSTYLAGVIIPLVALGIPLSGVSAGPAGPLFVAPPVLRIGHNLHDLLTPWQMVLAVTLGAVLALAVTYFIAVRWSAQITEFVMRHVPHEAVLALFIAFILLLAYIDAGIMNLFGVLLIGLVCGTLNRMGVNYGVQFMTLYASAWIVPELGHLLALG